jgi:hypothetical protein
MNAARAKMLSITNIEKREKSARKAELKAVKRLIKYSVKRGNGHCCYERYAASLYDTTEQWLKDNHYSYECFVDRDYTKISWR